jgi:sugar lactone lactonase YvrE
VLWVDAATGQGGGVLASNFGRPASVAWDGAARLWWVVDAAGHQLVNLSADGRELRRVGGRGAAGGQFNFPAAVAAWRGGGTDSSSPAADAAVALGVADAMNFRVQLLDAGGAAVNAFGQKGDGAGDFALPRDLAFDRAGHVYVLDSQFENVQVFDADGRLLLAFGEGGQRAGEFNVPSGIAIDERNRVWIADTRNRRVQAFEYVGE